LISLYVISASTAPLPSGELISLRDSELVFDSDEFGEQSHDREDIEELHTMKTVTLAFLNKDTVVSRISLVGDVVMLWDSGEEVSVFSILSIVPAEPNWWGLWEGKLSLGLSTQAGNTNQTGF
jgi:hypothetical protein